jgi:hypothetical protein
MRRPRACCHVAWLERRCIVPAGEFLRTAPREKKSLPDARHGVLLGGADGWLQEACPTEMITTTGCRRRLGRHRLQRYRPRTALLYAKQHVAGENWRVSRSATHIPPSIRPRTMVGLWTPSSPLGPGRQRRSSGRMPAGEGEGMARARRADVRKQHDTGKKKKAGAERVAGGRVYEARAPD